MLKLFFDGAVQPFNPGGHGGYGLYVEQDGQPVYSGAAYMGRWPTLSNNCAEYAGCIAALRFLIKNQIHEATVYGDANIVINQMAGRWGVKEGAYAPYAQEALTLRLKLPQVTYIWIPREQNTIADGLSKQSVTMMPRVVGFQLDRSIELAPLPKPRRRVRTRDLLRLDLSSSNGDDEAWLLFKAKVVDI